MDVEMTTELEKIKEKLYNAECIIMLLETDLSLECEDGVHYGAVKVLHNIIQSIRQDFKKLL